VVDHEIDRNQRVDLFRVAAEFDGRIAHGGKVDNSRHAGEVLHQNARRAVGNLVRGFSRLEPFGAGNDVFLRNSASVFKTQKVFQNDLQREGQSGNAFKTVFFRFGNGKVGIGLVTDLKCLFGIETIEGLGHGTRSPSMCGAAGPRLTCCLS